MQNETLNEKLYDLLTSIRDEAGGAYPRLMTIEGAASDAIELLDDAEFEAELEEVVEAQDDDDDDEDDDEEDQ